MFSMNANSFSSWLEWPPIAVFIRAIPIRSQRSNASRPSCKPSLVVKSECPLKTGRNQIQSIELALNIAQRFRVGIQRNVLSPTTHRGQLNKPVARSRNSFESIVQTIGMVAVRMTRQTIIHCHRIMPHSKTPLFMIERQALELIWCGRGVPRPIDDISKSDVELSSIRIRLARVILKLREPQAPATERSPIPEQV